MSLLHDESGDHPPDALPRTLARKECAFQVDPNHVVEFRFRHVHCGAFRTDTGIVDERVDAAEMVMSFATAPRLWSRCSISICRGRARRTIASIAFTIAVPLSF